MKNAKQTNINKKLSFGGNTVQTRIILTSKTLSASQCHSSAGSTTRMDLNKAEGCYQSMLLQEHRMRCSKTFGCCCVPRYLRRHGYRSHSPLSACEGGASMLGNHRKRGLSSPLPPVIALTSRPGRKASLPSFIAFSLWNNERMSEGTESNLGFTFVLTASTKLATSLGSLISPKKILIALFPFFTFTQQWVCAETLL